MWRSETDDSDSDPAHGSNLDNLELSCITDGGSDSGALAPAVITGRAGGYLSFILCLEYERTTSGAVDVRASGNFSLSFDFGS